MVWLEGRSNPWLLLCLKLTKGNEMENQVNKTAAEGELLAEDERLHSLIVEVLSKHRMVRMFEVEEGALGNSYSLIDRLSLDDGADVESGQVEVDALAWAIADKLAADLASRQVANNDGLDLSILDRYAVVENQNGRPDLKKHAGGALVLLSDVKALLATPRCN